MKFKELSKYLKRLEETSSRIEITKILATIFSKSSDKEIDKIAYLLMGGLAPKYESIVFNLAERMMILAIAKGCQQDPKTVRALYKKKGDLGIVAQSLDKTSGSDLSVGKVFDLLYKIAVDEGEGSQDRKVNGIASLLAQLDSLSARYVVRIPIGKLRLGFSDKTILDALSWMEKGDKSQKNEIERAYSIRPDVGNISYLVKTKGSRSLSRYVKPSVEVPVMPMLAQRLKSPGEMIKKMKVVSVEPKFDGLRILIHYRAKDYPKKGNEQYLRTYTRNMNFIDNNVFPELGKEGKFARYINAKEVILDTEAVGMDPEKEKFVDFQKTIQRRRKHNVKKASEDTPLQFQVFDILLKNGDSLLGRPYTKRREMLAKTIRANPLVKVDEYSLTSNPNEIRRLHKKYLTMGLEGIIVKKADSLYVAGRTGWRWVKMKERESSIAKLSDTIDCIVMGYSSGKGKRVSFGIGQFIVGIFDKNGSKITTLTKVGTGLTDDQFKELKNRLVKLEVKTKPKKYTVHKDLEPDYWVKPELVVEIAADEITKSPKHATGFALRFPRLVKFRDDKNTAQATSKPELDEMFKVQSK